jgi:N-acetylglucosamine kinase-like BadF-type ATPase
MGARMSLFVAVGGGNSKTDVVLADASGQLLRRVRTGPFRPQVTGVAAALDVVAEAIASFGQPDVEQLSAFVAGADLPVEEAELCRAFEGCGWARRVHVANDTFAVLHAGTTQGWGVAVVCGTGINCVGVGPDGSTARFPALGAITGDWGGGADLGNAVLWHAIRGEDGRGPRTVLQDAITAHFGTEAVIDVVFAVHAGDIDRRRLNGLTYALFEASTQGDPVAREILDRQACEIAAMATVAVRRLGLTAAEVVLGGGIITADDPYLMGRIRAELARRVPAVVVRTVALPPVAGAALHALGQVPGEPGARERLIAAFEETA